MPIPASRLAAVPPALCPQPPALPRLNPGCVRVKAALDALLIGAPLRLEERYAAAMRTLGIAMLCAPMLPLSPLIALAGTLYPIPCAARPEPPCPIPEAQNPEPETVAVISAKPSSSSPHMPPGRVSAASAVVGGHVCGAAAGARPGFIVLKS